MNVYFISGLGADRRAFEKLDLPAWCNIHHIEWLIPTRKEKFHEYAQRLSTQIDLNKPFSLVGLSFGGMVAVELSKIIKPEKTIIISSVSNSQQMPWHYKFLGKIKVYDLLPLELMKRRSAITNWFFGTKDKEEQKLLGETIHETDSTYLRWALKMISTWKSKQPIDNLFHIHGSADRLFPIHKIKPTVLIPNGAHLMIRENASEISKHLAEMLEK